MNWTLFRWPAALDAACWAAHETEAAAARGEYVSDGYDLISTQLEDLQEAAAEALEELEEAHAASAAVEAA